MGEVVPDVTPGLPRKGCCGATMSQAQKFSVGVIILAAGGSSRMGQPKLLLPWGNSSVLGHLIGLWTELTADQIAVVCSAADTGMEAELEHLRFPRENRIVNPDPGKGMFSSIQCAARWRGWK